MGLCHTEFSRLGIALKPEPDVFNAVEVVEFSRLGIELMVIIGIAFYHRTAVDISLTDKLRRGNKATQKAGGTGYLEILRRLFRPK